jgi:hypothetical protein
MTQIVSIQSKTFKFTDEIRFSSCYYNVNITVKELLYDTGILYYEINYKYEYVSSALYSDDINQKYKKIIHPFYGYSIENYMTYSKEIVVKNSLTSLMIEYILMDYDQLQKVSGATTAQKYKQTTMVALSFFWD